MAIRGGLDEDQAKTRATSSWLVEATTPAAINFHGQNAAA